MRDTVEFHPELSAYLAELGHLAGHLSSDRKSILQPLTDYIQSKRQSDGQLRLVFICTHNSRRSHLAQVWAQITGHYFDIALKAYSGGTEATAVYKSTLEALTQSGIEAIALSEGKNPVQALRYSPSVEPIIAFSKSFKHPYNPSSGFAAIMTCDHADSNCPFIPAAEARIPITYIDPKASDGTAHEPRTYSERCLEIATEMYYVMKKVTE